ncbi:ribonuclease H [Paenibacillus sp. H1-7]|uniref:ribonuclease H n=1 Tax=Paenibacillus sp. H1-7 TaxID=2282849 RepID=UPI001EF8C567|nr:ribonuclease H family protein [Paenibacillus sp. H1-7]ULL19187.1 ribonuclease H [Paenibacillus sp. H1-7]
MAKQKYYVVWEGKVPGIYNTWAECQAQTNGYPQARFKAYESESEAKAAMARGWKASFVAANAKGSTAGTASASRSKTAASSGTPPQADLDSLSVDVGSRGNPGIVEYKGVNTRTGEVVFQHPPIAKGTNNLGEFLAIVHALAYLNKQGSSMTIYSDSVTAISWVRKKEVATNLPRDASTEEIWTLVDRALSWLRSHTYSNKILKWDTKAWGEIKADYGRK